MVRASGARDREFDSPLRNHGKYRSGLSSLPWKQEYAGSNPAFPTNLLAGSKAAMRSAVNREMRRFESYPASQIMPGKAAGATASPTKRKSRVRSSAPVPFPSLA